MRDGWIATTLGAVADLSIGRTPPRAESRYWTSDLRHPFCTIADMTGKWVRPAREGVSAIAVSEGKARPVPPGTLLMSFKLTLGRVGFAATTVYPNEAIVAITPRDEASVLKEYLYLFLGNADLSAGSGRAVKGATLNSTSLAAINIAFPPLEEQRRIVDLIESVDAYIAALAAEEAALAATRSNLLGELLTRRGEDWIETTLGDVASVISGGTPSTQVPEYWGGDIVWTTPTEVVASNGGVITTSSRRLSAAGLANSSAKMLPPGAVLLTSRATIGAVALAGVPLCTNQGFASLVCGPSVLPKFLLYWCTSNTAEFTSRASGNTFPEISRSKVAGVPLVLPPLEEQRRIVDLVEGVDTTIAEAAGARQSAVALRTATLGALLSGDHEIPSSYDDLLETV